MAIRVSKILREANIGYQTLVEMLNTLGFNDPTLDINSKIPDDIANLVMALIYKDVDFLKLIEYGASKKILSSQYNSDSPLKIAGRTDLNSHIINLQYSSSQERKRISHSQNNPLYNNEKTDFWIEELITLSPSGKANRIVISNFINAPYEPLYSIVIGSNGVGKSSLMKEVIDFFIDLHTCQNERESKLSAANKTRLKGIKYHIDGVCCEVARFGKTYIAKINGEIRSLKQIRIPLIVACHFGTFDKFPVQRINGSSYSRYDISQYKYVGAHVNGNMISSSAIAFRLLFVLNENMDERQRHNIRSILDFIGYDHKISLQYSFVMKSKKDGAAMEAISQRVEKDREYNNLSKQEKKAKISQLYNFYKTKISSGKSLQNFEIDIDNEPTQKGKYDELQYIYKLKQCDLVSSANVIFYKSGAEITTEEMSSGEFAMLSTVLSISAAANDPHTLVLLDEPELSQHPNWQMTLIDNLDRALKNQVCHLLIATHSHMLVSDLPMNRSSVTQLEKDTEGNLIAAQISESTYGWSAEEVLLKVFKTATDRNRYFGERIGNLLEQMGNNTIKPDEVSEELKELQEISVHLSDVDPMKAILNTIVKAYQL